MLYVSWLAPSLSPSTVAVYLSAVRSYHIDWGLTEPTENKPRLRRVLQGILRSQSKHRVSRRPITKDILAAIYHVLFTSQDGYDATMFWAACSLAFFGFLRVSEFTSTLPFEPTRYLSGLRFELKCPKRILLGPVTY